MPIGDDQRPHLDLAQDLARIFNNNYGEFFPIPKPITGKIIVRRPCLDLAQDLPTGMFLFGN